LTTGVSWWWSPKKVTEGSFARNHRRKLPWGFIVRDAPSAACVSKRRPALTPLAPTNEAYAGLVSFEGTIVALHWLMADAVAEDRDE
jgi:hypothetical protein